MLVSQLHSFIRSLILMPSPTRIQSRPILQSSLSRWRMANSTASAAEKTWSTSSMCGVRDVWLVVRFVHFLQHYFFIYRLSIWDGVCTWWTHAREGKEYDEWCMELPRRPSCMYNTIKLLLRIVLLLHSNPGWGNQWNCGHFSKVVPGWCCKRRVGRTVVWSLQPLSLVFFFFALSIGLYM